MQKVLHGSTVATKQENYNPVSRQKSQPETSLFSGFKSGLFRNVFRTRYAVLFSYILLFVALSFITRTALLILSFHKADLSLKAFIIIYTKGFLFDLAVAVFMFILYSLYLLFLPQKLNNSTVNKIITCFLIFLITFIITFSFIAEFAFWDEFESRFNFIAVDYLVYTYEIVNNIRQSYPMPLLVSLMALVSSLTVYLFYRKHIFQVSFRSDTLFRKRLQITGGILAAALLCSLMSNSWAETNRNRYQNELSKAGIFSFVSAFKNNELNYFDFYKTIDERSALTNIRTELQEPGTVFAAPNSIRRFIDHPGTPDKQNVVLITIESMSATFLQHFGNKRQLTPNLDRLASEGILFTGMYATGTRTVRGMEALTLSIPPTPGNSIVRKPDNKNLFNIGSVYKRAGYSTSFFYGGDGYFDNMDTFFGNNGFDITDRQGGLIPHESLGSKHSFIPDKDVHFENAWGICDEDLYDAVIRNADTQYIHHTPFYDFVMTTSNHRPYTYPKKKIDIPSGSGRDGAVKYTDYAIGQFLHKAAGKPWFANTVFIFVADHCASSAGKDDIDVSKYHIPCIIYNAQKAPLTINSQCSQIDLFPTLFGLLNWKYESDFYGKDVLAPGYRPRALVGTYQQLGYLQHDSLVVLSPNSQSAVYTWTTSGDKQLPASIDTTLQNKAISYYQTAYALYKTGSMKR